MPDAPSPVPVLVIGGYLGSGKTTLVNHLLRSTSERLMVLVNDFGQSVIDAALVEATDGDVLQLAGGCVCCQIGDDLAGALQRAVDQRPDRLVIETSGVAQPAKVATSVAMFPGLAMEAVVVLADAERIRHSLADRYVGDLVTAQLRQADLVVLNRTDLVADPAAALAAVGAVAHGPVIPCAQAAVPPELLAGSGAPGAGRSRSAGRRPHVPPCRSPPAPRRPCWPSAAFRPGAGEGLRAGGAGSGACSRSSAPRHVHPVDRPHPIRRRDRGDRELRRQAVTGRGGRTTAGARTRVE
ncbi:MAG: GTP-binding protein [Ilumatobacteraceae bacterium]